MVLDQMIRESQRAYKGKVAVDAFIPNRPVIVELRDSNGNAFGIDMSFQGINRRNPSRFALFNEGLAFFIKRMGLDYIRIFPFKILHQENTDYLDFNDNKTYLPFRNVCLHENLRNIGQLIYLYKIRLEETK